MEEERNEQEEKRLVVTSKTLFTLFGVVSLGLLMFVKICLNFGLFSPTFRGIMSIFVYGLSFVGMVLTYLENKRVTFEFYVNLIAFALAIMTT